jgi:hypothetical protein
MAAALPAAPATAPTALPALRALFRVMIFVDWHFGQFMIVDITTPEF